MQLIQSRPTLIYLLRCLLWVSGCCFRGPFLWSGSRLPGAAGWASQVIELCCRCSLAGGSAHGSSSYTYCWVSRFMRWLLGGCGSSPFRLRGGKCRRRQWWWSGCLVAVVPFWFLLWFFLDSLDYCYLLISQSSVSSSSNALLMAGYSCAESIATRIRYAYPP